METSLYGIQNDKLVTLAIVQDVHQLINIKKSVLHVHNEKVLLTVQRNIG